MAFISLGEYIFRKIKIIVKIKKILCCAAGNGAEKKLLTWGADMCSYVFVGKKKHITIRIPEEVLAEIDADAERLKVSRNWVIERRLENSRTLPPLYSIDGETGEIKMVEGE